MILGVGARTGHADRAAQVVASMHDREAQVTAAIAGQPRPRVLMIFGLLPIVAAGPHTFADEMLDRAGADNAVRQGSVYVTLGMEQVLALNPEVVVNAAIAEAHGAERITKDEPGWRELRAVKEGHVVPISDESVLRPGPRVAEAMAILARALHPAAKIP